MRPRKIETLKDLKDFIIQCERNGMQLTDNFYIRQDNGDLTSPTFINHGTDGPGTNAFVVIDFWDDDALVANSAHCDKLGTEPHFVS